MEKGYFPYWIIWVPGGWASMSFPIHSCVPSCQTLTLVSSEKHLDCCGFLSCWTIFCFVGVGRLVCILARAWRSEGNPQKLGLSSHQGCSQLQVLCLLGFSLSLPSSLHLNTALRSILASQPSAQANHECREVSQSPYCKSWSSPTNLPAVCPEWGWCP